MTDITQLEMRVICMSSLFDGYSPLELVVLLEDLGARRLTFADGQLLANESDGVTQMAVVLSGNLHIYDASHGSRCHLMRIVHPGMVIGSTLVSTRLQKYPASVRAYGNGSCLVFSLAKIRALEKSGKARRFFDNLHTFVGEAMLESWNKCAILSCSGIAEKVAAYLRFRSERTRSKTVVIGSTEAAFADYLGVNRTALSRVLQKMQRQGKFTYQRGVFTLN